jgi:CxxC motif-containing protein (DUF1111 family)
MTIGDVTNREVWKVRGLRTDRAGGRLQLAVASALALAWAGCGGSGQAGATAPESPSESTAMAAGQSPGGSGPSGRSEVRRVPPGQPLAGLASAELARFQAGQAEFEAVEGVADGLGPVFNDDACVKCHSVPGTGGGSPRLETRFGTTTGGHFDPLTSAGGSLIQAQGIGIAGECNFVGELVPPQATLVSQRRSTPLFGLGLVDAIPDDAFQRLARQEAWSNPGQAGRVGMVQDIAAGRLRPGRFGWKDQVPSLHQFAGDAYLNEMGITSPEFPDESCPQGDCALLRCNPMPTLNDDGSGPAAFQDFMTFLGPPERGTITPGAVNGRRVFETIGCSNCHAETLVAGSVPSSALSGKAFHPYSDFLLHDMGSLGDGIALGGARGSEFRTAPLWGLRFVTTYLHDGRASTIPGAIQVHDGQARQARDAYRRLSSGDRNDLLQFLGSL